MFTFCYFEMVSESNVYPIIDELTKQTPNTKSSHLVLHLILTKTCFHRQVLHQILNKQMWFHLSGMPSHSNQYRLAELCQSLEYT